MDISFAILITARCRGKQNISANERLRDVSGGTLGSAPAKIHKKKNKNELLSVEKSVSPFRLVCRDIPQRKNSRSRTRFCSRLPSNGPPGHCCFSPLELEQRRPGTRADVDLCCVCGICADLHTAPQTQSLAARHEPKPRAIQRNPASCYSMKCPTFHGLSSILHLLH